MFHVVSFSTGLLSALTLERVVVRYGFENVISVFMDTSFEDNDNYRYKKDCKEYLSKKYKMKFLQWVTLLDGRTPYEVSRAQHVIPNSLVAPCTRRLKIEPFKKYLLDNYIPENTTIHIGYDFSEMHRCEPTRASYEKWAIRLIFLCFGSLTNFASMKLLCAKSGELSHRECIGWAILMQIVGGAVSNRGKVIGSELL
jgi:hypothetical protein